MMRSRRTHRLLPLLLAAVLSLGAGLALAADWPQFRGPARDGISKETGLLASWPAAGPRRLWRAATGDGYSGVAVAGGKVLSMVGRGGDELVLAWDAATGRELWRTRVDAKLSNDMGDGPRSTPTVDGGLVYALGARGKLVALQAASGKTAWSRDLRGEMGARPPQWGVSTSPLVEGNLLLVDVGGSSGKSLAALDKKTGKTVWTSQSDQAGYSAPIAFTVGGVRHAVFFTGTSVVAVKPADGKLLWRVPWRTDYDVNAAAPIFIAPDKLFVSSGYDTGAGLFRIRAGNGKAAVEEVWTSRRMKNQFSSSVLRDGHIYGFDNKTLKCIVAATGEERWKQSGLGHGSLILADGRLVVLSESGELALVDATPEAYRERGRFRALSGRCWSAPSLANGVLYVRNQEELLAFDVKGGAKVPAPAKGR